MGPMTMLQVRNQARGPKASVRRPSFRSGRLARSGLLVLAGGAALMLGTEATGQKRSLETLDQLEPGSWELREHGTGGSAGDICIRSGRQLIQLRHPGLNCKSVTVEDSPTEVVVQYMCAGQGYGRTRIRRETNALVQIDSQGIANGQPFAYAGEGRRAGACR